jgi:hypothetical protein
MLTKTTIALSTALAFAAASSALAMTNPKNSVLPRSAVALKQTTIFKYNPAPASLAVKAWYDHYRLGFGT